MAREGGSSRHTVLFILTQLIITAKSITNKDNKHSTAPSGLTETQADSRMMNEFSADADSTDYRPIKEILTGFWQHFVDGIGATACATVS